MIIYKDNNYSQKGSLTIRGLYNKSKGKGGRLNIFSSN
jgi:hypothetical protein